MANLIERIQEPEWILSVCVMGFLMSLTASYAQRGLDSIYGRLSRVSTKRQEARREKRRRSAEGLLALDVEARLTVRLLTVSRAVGAQVQVAIAMILYVFSLVVTILGGRPSVMTYALGLAALWMSVLSLSSLRRARVLGETVDELNKLLHQRDKAVGGEGRS